MPLNDEKLILQIQRGNIEYANELIEKHYSSILRYCTWHCHNTDRAEDLTQETFLRVFRDIDSYEQRGSFRAYLYTMDNMVSLISVTILIVLISQYIGIEKYKIEKKRRK